MISKLRRLINKPITKVKYSTASDEVIENRIDDLFGEIEELKRSNNLDLIIYTSMNYLETDRLSDDFDVDGYNSRFVIKIKVFDLFKSNPCSFTPYTRIELSEVKSKIDKCLDSLMKLRELTDEREYLIKLRNNRYLNKRESWS